jgi:acetyltransferase-like isoleucine patch superfamily enzyme
LSTADFICLGINSPKFFRKYLDGLEAQYGAKVVSVQAKNKDRGWHSLAYKVRFANGKVYLRNGHEDAFVRGFIHAYINCRPCCYECKFKGFPRISDLTLGDFWGIENFDAAFSDDKGTSVVLVNSERGERMYADVESAIVCSKRSLAEALPANQALIRSIPRPHLDRDAFFADLEAMPFDRIVKKYFPKDNAMRAMLKKAIRGLSILLEPMGWSIVPYLRFIRINLIRKNTVSSLRRRSVFVPARHAVVSLDGNAKLDLRGSMIFGKCRIKGSKLESRLAVEGTGSLCVEGGNVTVMYGSDILVFDSAKLVFHGNAHINQCAQIICMDRIEIGKDVMISRDVVIRDNDGGHEILAEGYRKTAPVIIGNHVWIGQGAMIVKGVTIGDGAIIGAGAWVASNVKQNTLVMGDPARAVQKNVEWKY